MFIHASKTYKCTWNDNWNTLCTSLLLLTCSLYGSGLAGLTLTFDATSVSGDCGNNAMSVHQVTSDIHISQSKILHIHYDVGLNCKYAIDYMYITRTHMERGEGSEA